MKTIVKMVIMTAAAGCLLGQNDPGPVAIQKLNERFRVQIDQAAAARNGTVAFVSGQLVSTSVVKGAPYSADAVTETTQTLADGNRIVRRTSSKQYRDSEGRERREETSAMGAIFITDPVAKLSYTLHPETQTAEKSAPRSADTLFILKGNGVGTPFSYSISPPGVELKTFEFSYSLQTRTEAPQPQGQSLRTILPAMMIEGVQAQGSRTTTTIPAGQVGNERPIDVVEERWYSPDLQMTVMTKHSDPREGETVYKLTNIQRIEQVRSLFEIPNGYIVKESQAAGGRGAVLVPRPAQK